MFSHRMMRIQRDADNLLATPVVEGRRKLLSLGITLVGHASIVAASVVGILAFLLPFVVPAQAGSAAGVAGHSQDAPFFFVLLTVLLLTTVVSSLSGGQMNSKMVAVLGIMTAVSAVLRLVPGPAGFSAIFFLPILAGYAYGAGFGFLLGCLSLLVSALLGAGVGPWLPFQMFATGWVGLLSGILGRIVPAATQNTRWEVSLLSLWGVLAGLFFGVVMNLWFWPYLFAGQSSDLYWQPGLTLSETLGRYLGFYLATSAWWDGGRALGNGLLLAFLSWPTLRLLRRFRMKFHFEIAA